MRELAPGLPAAASRALARGMAREAAERPASAGELAAELRHALGARRAPEPTTRDDADPGGAAPAARARVALASAGPLAVALIALAAGAVIAAVLLAGGGDGDKPKADSAQRPDQAQAPTETTPPETTPPQTTPHRHRTGRAGPGPRRTRGSMSIPRAAPPSTSRASR